MCGIIGIVAPKAGRLRDEVERGLSTLAHRGPDGGAIHVFDDCILGHRRLAIVDLERGEQPMLTPDRTTGITFNGAIYGFREIRKMLEKDVPFLTSSDTEVILALYRKHGRDLLTHLPGMFAFGIWDQSQQLLFAARDRFGQKPFFYAFGPDGELIFASEIKAIAATGLVQPELSRESLAHYLHRRYVPVGRTIWNNIHALPPAHFLTFQNGATTVRRYWDLPPVSEPLSVDHAVAEMRERLEESVRRHLVADVPVTAFLSGGLDSTTVVSIASRLHPGIRTLSFGYGSASELPWARESAERYGTDHLEVEDRDLDVGALLLESTTVFEEPHADPSDLANWEMCREVRKHGRVVLTGEGGDELLAGYRDLYTPLLEMERWQSRSAMLTLLASLAERISNRLRVPHEHPARRWMNGASRALRDYDIASSHRNRRGYFHPPDLARLGFQFTPPPVERLTDTVNDALRHDLRDLLPGNWLVRTDRASMAHGVELRSPFLDDDLASFCISLPSRLKITRDETKWILRRAFEADWTPAVRSRKIKQGFSPAWGPWLRRPGMDAIVRRVLNNPRHRLYDLLPFREITAMTDRQPARVWIILVLGLWVERWLP